MWVLGCLGIKYLAMFANVCNQHEARHIDAHGSFQTLKIKIRDQVNLVPSSDSLAAPLELPAAHGGEWKVSKQPASVLFQLF